MNYTIYKEDLLNIANGTPAVRAELVASSSENIPYYSDVSGRTLAVGSVALVPSESKLYILDNDLLWTDWESGTKLSAPAEQEEQNA
ncbi:hypothetical protein SAMN02910317_01154 [Ruminococcaceae bacterium FB2012]|nr:hypothetical protein SAMN02910317_01154 [Ruminococcaceae bacterium FB2012]